MDRLTLRIENRSDAAGDVPDDISVLGKGISIGRKKENDWSLPDNTRFISGRHVSITYEGEGYVLEDVSTNGTFLNGSTAKVAGKHILAHGDTIRIGSYIVAVDIVTEEISMPQISGAQGVQAPPTARAVSQPPAAGVPRNVPPAVSTPPGRGAQAPDFSRFQTGTTGAAGVQRPGVSMPPMATPAPPATPIPDDFDDDLLGLIGSDPDPVPDPEPAAMPTPPQAAQTPEAPAFDPAPTSDPAVSFDPAPASDPAPAFDPAPAPEVPQDPAPINKDAPFETGAAPSTPAQVNETPAFEVTPVPQSGLAPPPVTPAPGPEPLPERTSPFSPTDPTGVPFVPRDPVEVTPQPVVERTDVTPRGLGERFAETAAPRPVPVAPEVPAPVEAAPAPEPTPEPAPAEPAINALLEGFLEGAGIPDADQLGFDLHELGVMLGKCARLGTQEMMHMLQDRSAVKLFVANDDRTMRIASGNNPMKFMADPDEAFLALFVQPRDGYQTGPDGFDNALADIRQHQKAMMAAIQPALADMLEGLAPKEIASDAGGGRLGSGARKSWEEYEKRWDARAAQGENGMVDAFIDAFSRRYTQALDSL